MADSGLNLDQALAASPDFASEAAPAAADLHPERVPTSVPEGKNPTAIPDTIPVINAVGNLTTLPAGQVKEHVSNHGYRLPSNEELQNAQDKEEYGESTLGAVKEMLRSGASTATFGGSSWLLRSLGIESEEEQAKSAKYHPVANFLGIPAGVAASAIATGGASLLGNAAEGAGVVGGKAIASGLNAVLNPLSVATRAGEAVAGAVAPGAAKFAGLLANPETAPIVNNILAKAGAAAVGEIIPGAAMGFGNAVEESALGDPKALSEKLWSNIGLGAAMGFGLGAAGGAIKGGFKGALEKYGKIGEGTVESAAGGAPVAGSSIVDKVGAASGELSAAAKGAGYSDGERAALKESTGVGYEGLSPEDQQLIDYSNEHKLPVFDEFFTKNKMVKDAGVAIQNAPRNIWTSGRQDALREGVDATDKLTRDALTGTGTTTGTIDEVGNAAKKSLSDILETHKQKMNELYGALKEKLNILSLGKGDIISGEKGVIEDLRSKIDKVEGVSSDSSTKKFAEGIKSQLENISNLDELRNYKTQISKSLEHTASPLTQNAKHQIVQLFEDTENAEIKKSAAKHLATDPKYSSLAEEMLNEKSTTNKQYRELKKLLEPIARGFGGRNSEFKGLAHAQEVIDSFPGEKYLQKITQSNDAEFTNAMNKLDPEGMKIGSNHIKSEILRKAEEAMASPTNKKNFTQTALKEIAKLGEKQQIVVFPEHDLDKLRASEMWRSKIDKSINLYKEKESLLKEIAKKPLETLLSHGANIIPGQLTGFLADHTLNSAWSPELAAKAANLYKMEGMINKTTNLIHKGIRNVLTNAEEYGIPTATGAMKLVPPKDDKEGQEKAVNNFKKLRESLLQFQSNPEAAIDHVNRQTSALYNHAPNTTHELQNTLSRGISFLASKLPVIPTSNALSEPYAPNNSELSKFQKYYDVVNNPVSVLNDLRANTLTPDHMEALNTVYPTIAQEMKSNLVEKLSQHMSKQNPIPYSKKLSLSLFLGSDMVNSLNQSQMASHQTTFARVDAENDRADQAMIGNRVNNSKGVGKLDIAGRMKNELQENETRA